jgi:hypothetical protein
MERIDDAQVELEKAHSRLRLRSSIHYPLSTIFFLLPLLLFVPGCNLMGFAADKAGEYATQDAQYVPKDEPTVVIAENWKNPSGTELDSEEMARDVYDELRSNDFKSLIDPVSVIDLRSQRPDFHSLSVSQIGKLVGAKQVIYINVTSVQLMSAEGSDSVHGQVTGRVKVIDVETAEARWPTDSMEGYPISISSPMATAHNDRDETTLRADLIQAAAIRVSKLFYKSKVEDD